MNSADCNRVPVLAGDRDLIAVTSGLLVTGCGNAVLDVSKGTHEKTVSSSFRLPL
jgi:hypothetical protein